MPAQPGAAQWAAKLTLEQIALVEKIVTRYENYIDKEMPALSRCLGLGIHLDRIPGQALRR
jgi:hypothetical protein